MLIFHVNFDPATCDFPSKRHTIMLACTEPENCRPLCRAAFSKPVLFKAQRRGKTAADVALAFFPPTGKIYEFASNGRSFDPLFSLDIWDHFQGFQDFGPSREVSAVANTQIDWKETPEAHVFKADLSSLFSSGSFLRWFRLPGNAKVDEIKASREKGVPTVTVPKQPQPKPEVKSVEISG
eukprot:Gb_39552 [translate_table: standard]